MDPDLKKRFEDQLQEEWDVSTMSFTGEYAWPALRKKYRDFLASEGLNDPSLPTAEEQDAIDRSVYYKTYGFNARFK